MKKQKQRNRIHRPIPMHESQRHIREAIASQGFAIRQVLATESAPAFAYTVGLHIPGSQKPELLISGLRPETRVAWLFAVGFRIQGPPPLHTCRQLAQAQGIPLQALRFPAGGLLPQPGKRYTQWDVHELPTLFAELAPEHYETHLGQALAFHGTSQFPCLQLIWPDTQGIFPWGEGFEERFRPRQELLFDVPRFVSSLSTQQ